MTLLFVQVLLANVLTRAASLGAAFWLSGRSLARRGDELLGVACGFLLSLSLLHLLPEALEGFESQGIDLHDAGVVLFLTVAVFIVGGMLFGSGHVHGEGGGGTGTAALLVGALMHSAVDGMLIAATFMVDERAGWLAALAVVIHEVPQQTGYMLLFERSGMSAARAFLCCLVPAFSAVAGGALGCATVSFRAHVLPYLLAVSSASFLFITLCGLIPEVVREMGDGKKRMRTLLAFLAGIALSLAVLEAGHHDHHQDHGEHGPEAALSTSAFSNRTS